MTDPTGDERLLAAAREAFGEVDILILNGPGPKSRPAAHVSEPDVVAAIDTLLRPQVRASAVLPGMRDRRWGRTARRWPARGPLWNSIVAMGKMRLAREGSFSG